MVLQVKGEVVPNNIPDEYRLDSWQTGVKERRFCSLMFPNEFPKNRAMAIIRRRLGMLPLSYYEE